MFEAGRIRVFQGGGCVWRPCRRRLRGIGIQYLLLAISTALPATAAPPGTTAGTAPRKAFAILVGVEDYHRLSDLRCCNKDVELVRNTLQQYCACDKTVVMTGESKGPYKPTLGNILAVLDMHLRFADEERFDRIIIFFAGHGLRDRDGRLYFVPQDCYENLIERTGLSVALVRTMLEKCHNIGEKILILDTCHAGSRRGTNLGPSGRELAEELQGAKRILTLASCGPDEESLEWDEKEHGLFTYWLCEGLSGAADRGSEGDGNGLVDTVELAAFVTDHVKRTSRDLGCLQTPEPLYSEDTPWKTDLAFVPPDVNEPERLAMVDLLLVEANKYRKGGNYAAAIDQVNRVLGIAPDSPQAFARRGVVHLDRGKSRGETVDPAMASVDFGAAIDDFDRAISLSGTVPESARPPLAYLHSYRCDAHYELGDLEQALLDANRVIELEPEDAQAYRNRAKIYRDKKCPAKAEADEQKALKLSSSDPPT